MLRWLENLGRPRLELAGLLTDRELQWLREALAAAILAYEGDSRVFHAARIAFLQRLLKNLSENR